MMDYRARVGPPDRYDLAGAAQFNVLTALGLREGHALLDIGCGSLRAGRLFIPYLAPGGYVGVDPDRDAIKAGLQNELSEAIVYVKRPTFYYRSAFGFDNLPQVRGGFDFALAHSIFSHAGLIDISVCLHAVRAVLAPSGLFVGTFQEGPEDYTAQAWVYPGVVCYQESTIAGRVALAHLAYERLDYPHPSDQTWFLASRAGGRACDLMPPAAARRLAHLERIAAHPLVRAGLWARALFQ